MFLCSQLDDVSQEASLLLLPLHLLVVASLSSPLIVKKAIAPFLYLRKRIIEIPYRIAIYADLAVGIPIAHELVGVPCPIADIKILITNILQQLKEV
jgi:hypothetical protein